jgi:HAMP domain-containing protein
MTTLITLAFIALAIASLLAIVEQVTRPIEPLSEGSDHEA